MTDKTKRKPTAARVADDWDEFVARLSRETMLANDRTDQGKKLAPYDAPEAILKRLTYAFVRKQRAVGADTLLANHLFQVCNPPEPRTRLKDKAQRQHHKAVTFKDNPFDYTLRALAATGERIHPSVRNRFGRQMIYADRHDVDPNLLIGFLHQSGNMEEIAEKAKDPSARELWSLQEKKVHRHGSAPLVVIDFNGTEQSLDGFPVRMARAKVEDPAYIAEGGSTLIRPAPSWPIDDEWYACRGKDINVARNKLLQARTARDVVETLTVYTMDVQSVYCYDIRLCSHFLDVLCDAAGISADFTLRDVGEYLDHDVSKRIALRDEIKESQRSSNATLRAKALCDALVDLGDAT